MKKLFTICNAMLLSAFAFAQSPDKMSYQAVIRNSSNALVTNQPVGMRISILQGSSSGDAVYVETHSPTTNANGLASIEIGGGIVVSGTFSTINWANGPYFVKTETDPAGGTSYSIMGTSQLLSVPYALHAKNTDSWTVNADSIYTYKKVGIGTSSPKLSLDIRTDNTSTIRGAGFSQYSSNNFASLLFLNKFRGSLANPSPVINSDYTGGLILSGYNGTSNSVSSMSIGSIIIGGRINGNVTSNSLPQDLYFATGATTNQIDPYGLNTVRMVISSTGNVGIGTTTPVRKLHINSVMRLEPTSSSPTNPSKGDIYFDNNLNKLRVYDGTIWQNCW
jgi:hypothetical protein